MKHWGLLLVVIISAVSGLKAQAITGIDFSHLYRTDADVTFRLKAVRQGQTTILLARLESNRKDILVSDYTVSWEQRASVNARSGSDITAQAREERSAERSVLIRLEVPTPAKTWFALARITHRSTKAEFFAYVSVEPNWPTVFYLDSEADGPVTADFINTGSRFTIRGAEAAKKIFVFFYKKSFSPAPPPFATNTQAERFLRADSVFQVTDGIFIPSAGGLYLLQQDTVSAEGLSVWAGDAPFPRFNRISTLTGPMVYVTTGDEQQALKTVGQDKAKFDKIVLGITRDKERAKAFMRAYFQRVEESNSLFTGFKEGWKTDRGMVRLVFGPPSEVSRTTNNEIWYYKDSRQKFVFYRTGSVYEPMGYFLERSGSYTQTWYSTIDLWRKGRF